MESARGRGTMIVEFASKKKSACEQRMSMFWDGSIVKVDVMQMNSE